MEQFVLNFPWVRANHIPIARLKKSMAGCKVAIVSTGGLYGPNDVQFAIKNSTDVDESYREIPVTTPLSELHIAHEHFNKAYAALDMNVIFPVERMQALAAEGVIGQLAEINYSITGYIPHPEQLYQTGREIVRSMEMHGVDAALIVPV